MSCNQGHLTHPEYWPGDCGDLLGIASPAPGNHYVMLRFVATVMAATALGVSADSVNAVLRDLFEVEG